MLNEQVRSVNNFFCFNVRKYNRKITWFFDEHLKKLGIRSTQIYLLLALSEGGKSLVQTSENLGMDRSTLSRGFRRLEKIGLIKRIHSEDGRSKIYALTDYGKDMAKKGTVLLQEAQDITVGLLGNERYARLSEDLSL